MRTATKTDLLRYALLRNAMATLHTDQCSFAGHPCARLGDHKVLVAAIWDAWRDGGASGTQTLAEFKRWLLQAMLIGDEAGHPLVVLVRIDSTEDVDPDVLRASEISDRGALFHAVLDPAASP